MSYDKFPFVQVSPESCAVGWDEVASLLAGHQVLCVECYPGALEREIEDALCARLEIDRVYRASDFYRSPAELNAQFQCDLTGDPVFGRMNKARIADFLDLSRRPTPESRCLVIGTGASLLVDRWDLLVYVDMARWELQLRQRRNEIGNLGLSNLEDRPALKYKRAFFLDWRAADRLKKQVLPKADFVLDTHHRDHPNMISGAALFEGLRLAAARPFRVVPFFDPGPWGGQWMKEVCDLPREAPNYAWCFDCVPEENSLLLGFGPVRFEVPSIDLVFFYPRQLLGDAVHARFGTEFPIRFDFLDTMEGGNLSFQVHPLTEYIQETFGMAYTQDESYYLLEAGEGARVYLGLQDGVDREAMARDLQEAQSGAPFPAERYANVLPARKHDHFLIPAGTPHCSGKSCMVLEISATPYIFTFKMWDWGRLGLDGRPRPIHLVHALCNIQWDRTAIWVTDNLVNRIEPIQEGPGWREERTGLHEREFIETRRHWFHAVVPHDTQGCVNVINLVEGSEAIVESPTGAFEPMVVHYAETFIVPAAVGPYTIRPGGPGEHATLKASVRCRA